MRIDTKEIEQIRTAIEGAVAGKTHVCMTPDLAQRVLDLIIATTPLTRERLELALKASHWEQEDDDKNNWFESEKEFTIMFEDIGEENDWGFYADCGDVNINSIPLSSVTLEMLKKIGIVNAKA